MNFYKRHLGDYAKDAGHLLMLEHGAYTLLLDRYYTTELPIPKDDAYRVCRARSKDERAAVDAVLREFFASADGVFHNRRADEEIAKASHQREVNHELGKRGGRPKRTEPITESVSQSVSEQEPNDNPSQTPDTRHQTKASEAIASAASAAQTDRQEAIFVLGLPLLLSAGVPEPRARSFFGRLRKFNTDDAIVMAIDRCAKAGALQPVEFLQGCLKTSRHFNRQEAQEQDGQRVAAEWLQEQT